MMLLRFFSLIVKWCRDWFKRMKFCVIVVFDRLCVMVLSFFLSGSMLRLILIEKGG